jgi:hypothetical protein
MDSRKMYVDHFLKLILTLLTLILQLVRERPYFGTVIYQYFLF